MSHRTLPLFALLCCLTGVRAQVSYTQIAPRTFQGSSSEVAAYDVARRVVVLWDSGLGTIEFDGQSWVQRPSLQSPPVQLELKMVYDEVRQRTVLFGRASTQSAMGVWEWDGNDWTPGVASPLTSPQTATFDEHRGTIVLFGNMTVAGLRTNPLYEYDGTIWRVIPTTGAPPVGTLSAPVFYNGLVRDVARHRLVMLRVPATFPGQAEVWECDAAGAWSSAGLGPDSSPAACYDRRRGVITSIGRNTGTTIDIWEHVPGSGWSRRAQIPGATAPIVFDRINCRVLLLPRTFLVPGGVWAGTPTRAAEYVPVGTGCPGTNGVARLELLEPCSFAWLGASLMVKADGIAGSAAFLVMGFGDQSFGSHSLPFALDNYGMPGCSLRVAPDGIVPATVASGRLTANVPVPWQAGLLGVVFFHQAMLLEPAANAAGAVWSDSSRGVVGGR